MNWAHYIIQVNIYLVVFYGFYKLLLDKETYFTLNRIYLIAAGSLSLAIPFLRFEWFAEQPVAQPVYVGAAQINELVTQVVIAPETPDRLNLGTLLVALYLLGVFLFLLKLIYQLYAIRRIIQKNGIGEAFSFFRRQFVDDQLPGSQTISKHEEIHTRQLHSADVLFFEILATLTWFNPVVYFYKSTIKNIHEYLADEEAAQFQGNKDQYAMLLMSNALGVPPSTLINGFFNKPLLKKRIYMLYKQRSKKVAILKYGLFVPLFAITLVASSATIRNNEQIKDIANEIPIEKPLEVVKEAVKEVVQKAVTTASAEKKQAGVKTPVDNELQTETTATNRFADWAPFYQFMSKTIKYPATAREASVQGTTAVKFTVRDGMIEGVGVASKSLGSGLDAEVMRAILAYKDFKGIEDGDYLIAVAFSLDSSSEPAKVEPDITLPGHKALSKIYIRGYQKKPPINQKANELYEVNVKSDDSGKIYDFVSLEAQPSFPGGMDQFYAYVQRSVKYPQEAKDQKIEGKVFLSFVVETDGTLSDIKVERKLGAGTDEEAIRVIEESPRWIPGVQNGQKVRVKYNIPISFSLNKSQSPPLANVTDLLQGKVTGVTIQSGRLGEPKPNSPTSPLYIIDGVKIKKSNVETSPLSALSQDEIASIEVLKDETAKTLYGDEGKYGVILITTTKDKNTTKPAEQKKVTKKPVTKASNKKN